MTMTAKTPLTTKTAISCIECGRAWIDEGERWRMKVLDEEPRETVPYCPNCAQREFDE
jgi:hypothetical protein